MTDLLGGLLFDEPLLRLGAGLPLATEHTQRTAQELLEGSYAENRPRPTLPRAYPGAILRSYADDYYHRFWAIPPLVELGSVSINVQQTVRLWSAYLHPVTVQTWHPEGQLDGVALISDDAHPRTLPALAMESFKLSALGEGEAIINGRFRWVTSEEEPILTVTGQRAVLWSIPLWPNWAQPVIVKYEYLTEIIPARDGTEQRLRKRYLPRKTVEFESRALDTAQGQYHREMRMMMLMSQNKTFVVPEWTRRAFLTSDMGANDQTIHVHAVPPWLYAGRQIIVTDGVNVDLLTVDTTDEAMKTITLKAYASTAWKTGAAVMPALSCYMPDKVSGTLHLPQASTHQIVFTQFPTTEQDAAFDEGAPEFVFDGREVFLRRPNWRVDLTLEDQWPVETIMHDSGPVERFRIIDFPSRVTKFSVMSRTQEETESIRRFFMRQHGRQKEFWFPSQEDDFSLKEPSYAGLNTVRVEGLSLLQLYQQTAESLRAIEFVQLDGTRVFMKIQSVELRSDFSGVDTLISLTTSLPAHVGPGYTRRISWLYLARFAIDAASFVHETPGVAQVELSVQSLPYREAE